MDEAALELMRKRMDEMIEKAFFGDLPRQPKSYLRASSTFPGYVIEEEPEPGSCDCPKWAVLHRPGCWVWST